MPTLDVPYLSAPSVTNASLPSLTVLLVEDNDVHARLICRQLQKAAPVGLKIEHVDRLQSALKRLSQGGISAVLLDLSLPDSELKETLGRVMESSPEAPIIVLTSLDDLEFATATVQQGAQDFLVKVDLDGATLVRSIRYAVERKKAADEIKATVEELGRSNERLKNFAHTVAHEVKSPLGVMSGFLTLLKDRHKEFLSAEVDALLHESEMAVRGLAELVQDLLEFSKVGSRREAFGKVDMESVFYQAYVHMRSALRECGGTIKHDSLPTILGDEVQLRHVLHNLLSNAVKYRGPEAPDIFVTAHELEQMWVFEVRDNGVGIAADNLSRVFDTFVRLPETQDLPGTGIGLSFCKRVIEFHGGRIWAESQLGQGSSFYFTLPKIVEPAAASAEESSAKCQEVKAAEANAAGAQD